MILCLIENIDTSAVLLQGASLLSKSWKKKFGVLILNIDNEFDQKNKQLYLQKYIHQEKLNCDLIQVSSHKISDIQSICDAIDVAVLVIQQSESRRSYIMSYLKACRNLRIPYIFVKNLIEDFKFDKLMVPVSFLVEEVEKAQFAAAFGRFCESEICILQAKDYGSKAAENAVKISSILDKFELKYKVEKGEKDSFKIEYDALKRSRNESYDLLLITASREYGLDDLFFGPKEYHLLRKTKSALMLINPRADLYALCD